MATQSRRQQSNDEAVVPNPWWFELRNRLPLATPDRALARAAQTEGVALIGA